MSKVKNDSVHYVTDSVKPKNLKKQYIAVAVAILATMGLAVAFFLTTIPAQANTPVLPPEPTVQIEEPVVEVIEEAIEEEIVEVNGIVSDDPEIQRLYELANNPPENYDTMTLEEAVEHGYLTPEDAAQVVQ